MFLPDVNILLHGQILVRVGLKKYYCQFYAPQACLEVCLGGSKL